MESKEVGNEKLWQPLIRTQFQVLFPEGTGDVREKNGEIKSHFDNTIYASSWIEPTNAICGETRSRIDLRNERGAVLKPKSSYS
jgi:hypothetical protein